MNVELGLGAQEETPIRIGVREEWDEGLGRGTEKKEGRRGGEHEVTIMYKA